MYTPKMEIVGVPHFHCCSKSERNEGKIAARKDKNCPTKTESKS